jgi:NAD(P)-dependent dehydrogenase (short-subunit alcohol dehydrogenase family)
LAADITDPTALDQAVSKAEDLGPLYGLVHVAGGISLAQWQPLLSTPPELFDDVLALNLRAALLTTQAVGRRLVERDRPGSIVHIASIAGLTSMPYAVSYGVAKAGMMALTRTAAVEWGRHGIRVNAVAPGTVRTRKNVGDSTDPDRDSERAVIPLRRRALPDDVAGAVLWLLSDLAGFVSGQVVAVDGGSSARASYLDEHDLPVFVRNEELRDRLLGRSPG